MSHVHILNAVFNSPWAIHRPWLGSIFQVLHARLHPEAAAPAPDTFAAAAPRLAAGAGAGGSFTAARWGLTNEGRLVNHSARIEALAARRAGSWSEFHDIVGQQEAALEPGQILHVFGSGILGKHLSAMDETCAGGLSVDRIQSALKLARDDDKIAAVILHLNTPGGVCHGMPETASLVRQVRAKKTIVSFSDSLTASAGLWCTCAADAYYLTPSADIGSIGVYSAVYDYTEYCAKMGVKVELIKDGTYKGAGYMGTVLTEEQRAKIQTDVLQCSAAFKADVRAARPGVTDETMQGQCFMGRAAVEAGLADSLVDDLDAVLADIAKTL